MSDKCLFDRPLDIKNELASRRCQNLYVAAVGSQNQLVNSPWNNELHKDGGKCNRSCNHRQREVGIRSLLLCSARTLLMLAI